MVRQFGVGMRVGLDVASIILKRQANTIIPVSGVQDLVPSVRLVRREGAHFTPDLPFQNIGTDFSEHIPFLSVSFPCPAARRRTNQRRWFRWFGDCRHCPPGERCLCAGNDNCGGENNGKCSHSRTQPLYQVMRDWLPAPGEEHQVSLT